MRLLCSIVLVLMTLAGVAAQSSTATCGAVPDDVTFLPDNCIEAGSSATMETSRFRAVGIASVSIVGPTGRLGGRDHGVRMDGDGIIRLNLDTNNVFGVRMSAGTYQVIMRDITGRVSPIIAVFEVVGGAPTVSSPLVEQTPAVSPTPTTTDGFTPVTTPPPGNTPVTSPTLRPTTPAPIDASVCGRTPAPELSEEYPIWISDIDKVAEIVTLENISEEPVNLDGWVMCSVTGGQTHPGIGGIIEPGELREFRNTGGPIWLDNGRDDGALYNAEGRLMSYFGDS
jgi:hypothetical protein